MDAQLGRLVAVKTLPHLSAEASQRLRREARAMAAFSDPCVAQIHGLETWRGTPMLIMEYLPDGTLAEYLRHASMPFRQTLALGIELARTLERLHGRRLLHRDIKPSNIGFASSGAPKLLDFGLAEFVSVCEGHWTTNGPDLSVEPASTSEFSPDFLALGRAAGTPAYLSPEILNGEPVTPAVDLWSLSVVLYEAVTGLHPFRGEYYRDTLDRIRRAEPKGLAELEDRQSEMAAFFRIALSRCPTQRFPTAATLGAALVRLVDGLTSEVPA